MLLYLLPFIAAVIGWVTNYIAVKMLFHPRKQIVFLFVKIQGVFPKRQALLAEKLGNLVAKELFSVKDLTEILKSSDIQTDAKIVIELKVDELIKNFLAGNKMLAVFISDSLINDLKAKFVSEIEKALPEIIDTISEKLEEKVDIQKIVAEKVNKLSSDEVEKLLYSIMEKEFRFIEIVGAVLGFIIGCIQMLIVLV